MSVLLLVHQFGVIFLTILLLRFDSFIDLCFLFGTHIPGIDNYTSLIVVLFVVIYMAAHNLAAAKRLRKELQNLERQSKLGEEDDVYLRPSHPERSILEWTALLRGPNETPYEGGVFQLSIKCGQEYPLAPPTITFVTKVRPFCIFCLGW